MGIEDGGPREMLIEDASDTELDACPSCEVDEWLRAIARYKRGVCYVIYCQRCGKKIEERWSIIP